MQAGGLFLARGGALTQSKSQYSKMEGSNGTTNSRHGEVVQR